MNNSNWQQNWQQNYQQGYQPWSGGFKPTFNTNIIYVTGIEEALFKSDKPNTDFMYYHQDQPIMYRVRVDNEGRKQWQQFNYSSPNPEASIPATKADIIEIAERLKKLEDRLQPVEVISNAESNG